MTTKETVANPPCFNPGFSRPNKIIELCRHATQFTVPAVLTGLWTYSPNWVSCCLPVIDGILARIIFWTNGRRHFLAPLTGYTSVSGNGFVRVKKTKWRCAVNDADFPLTEGNFLPNKITHLRLLFSLFPVCFFLLFPRDSGILLPSAMVWHVH